MNQGREHLPALDLVLDQHVLMPAAQAKITVARIEIDKARIVHLVMRPPPGTRS